MPFLLRNIRRKMLGNNKIATYLLYAIGEILLVVVGILIAVSIDDWNQGRNQKAKEVEYMIRLKGEFESNQRSFESKRKWLEELLVIQIKLLNLHQHDSSMNFENLLYGIEVSGFAEKGIIRKDIWNDLYSTGNALIFTNAELQNRMSNFYNSSALAYQGLLSEINDYRSYNRLHAKDIIGATQRLILVEIWYNQRMNSTTEASINKSQFNKLQIVNRFKAVQELASNLADQIMVTQVVIKNVEKYIEDCDETIKELDEEIKRKS